MTTQVYRVYIKATPQAIWDAITKPGVDAAVRLPGSCRVRPAAGRQVPGARARHMQAMGMPEVVVDGEVLEADPPRKLVQTWRFLWDEEIAAEGPTRVTFDIEEDDGGVTRLTVTHELENAPMTAAQAGGRGAASTRAAAAGAGSSATSRRCSRRARRSRADWCHRVGALREPGLHPRARARGGALEEQLALARVARERRRALELRRGPRRSGRA